MGDFLSIFMPIVGGLLGISKQQKKMERDQANLAAQAAAQRAEAERKRKEGVQADAEVASAAQEARRARIAAMRLEDDGIRRGPLSVKADTTRTGLTIAETE